jgi:hypothetical protein
VKMSDEVHSESKFYYLEVKYEEYETVSLTKYITITCFIRVCRLCSFRNAHLPYNKKHTDFDGEISNLGTARPQFNIFPYSPHSQSISY